jgi:hypothetical protein
MSSSCSRLVGRFCNHYEFIPYHDLPLKYFMLMLGQTKPPLTGVQHCICVSSQLNSDLMHLASYDNYKLLQGYLRQLPAAAAAPAASKKTCR